MNTKTFLVSSFAGSIIYFLLGWLFYGKLFTDIYPPTPEDNLVYIYLGSLFFCFLLGYVFNMWAGISIPLTGLYAGGLIGLFYGLSNNFFMYANKAPNVTNMITDVAISAIMAGITGAVIAFVISRMK